jgi:thioredoxin reductase (NADPH)
VALEGGDELLARTVVLALGVEHVRLPVPRLADYEGVGVAYAVDVARADLRPGAGAVVVGGANSAGQAALTLAEEGHHVTLVVRASTLAGTMARYLRDRLAAEPAVEVLMGHEVRSVGGDPRLETVVAEDSATGELTRLEAAAIVVLIGARPGTGWLAGEIALDDDGYILTGPQLGAAPREPWQTLGREPFLVETSRPGVFAVGDVRSGSTKMVAPATGDGGMAVRFAGAHLSRQLVR